MRFIEDLRAEHVLIERVVGSLQTWAGARVRGEADASDGPAFLRFFRLYAGRYHHAREEQLLFPALIEHGEVPADRGPIPALLHDHRAMAELLDALALALDDPEVLARHADAYGRALLHHVDAENGVLFPECEARLGRSGAPDLPDRKPDPEEAAAQEEGARLAERHPPTEPPDMIRGESCTTCPAFGVRCEGVELEWWSDHEWDDFNDRVG
ncbi:MAG: hemerythrin domain-containing protein [Deltaproteobacteria bacterium]|nr:hemerythrin domain-containing protein [Deltaproteobacteria bacterium]